jgi:hypothetical protein
VIGGSLSAAEAASSLALHLSTHTHREVMEMQARSLGQIWTQARPVQPEIATWLHSHYRMAEDGEAEGQLFRDPSVRQSRDIPASVSNGWLCRADTSI